MSQTLQTVLEVAGGFLLGSFAIWFVNRHPRWRTVRDLAMAALALYVAVLMAFGHFTRIDAVWPVLGAVLFVRYGYGGEPRPRRLPPDIEAVIDESRRHPELHQPRPRRASRMSSDGDGRAEVQA